MAERAPVVSSGRRIPAIWLLPIVAAVLGIWVVAYNLVNEGPRVRIEFQTAEGIEAGNTKVKSRSVEIGVVEEVLLNDDLASVTVVAKLDIKAEALLREDTRFWVVRPRFGTEGVSGLSTIMSGAYIELQPGPSEPNGQLDYLGLEDPPITPLDAPGLFVTLVDTKASSLGVGQPVLFRGYPVGRIEEQIFDTAGKRIRYKAYIEEPYAMLVDKASRFWNASGISFSASAEGLKVEVGSVQTLLIGGVAFDIPDRYDPIGPVEDDAEFRLFDSEESTGDVVYDHSLALVVEFGRSIRGLVRGAPVEYRGIPVGQVKDLMTEFFDNPERVGEALRIVIEIEPARLAYPDDPEGVASMAASLPQAVEAGLRASLETGNLITGNLFVQLDFYPDAPPAEMGQVGEYQTIPTLATGLAGIGRQVSSVLAKVDALPIDETVEELNATLRALHEAIASQEVEALPANLNHSLEDLSRTLQSFSPGSPVYDQLERAVIELTRAMQSVEQVSRTLNEQPNTILFDKKIEPDVEPRGAR